MKNKILTFAGSCLLALWIIFAFVSPQNVRADDDKHAYWFEESYQQCPNPPPAEQMRCFPWPYEWCNVSAQNSCINPN